MIGISDFISSPTFEKSRFYSRAIDAKNKISEVGQSSLAALSKSKSTLILAGGLLAIGAIYSGKLIACMQEQEDSSDLMGQCHEQIIADGVNKTLAFTAVATSLISGVSQYLATKRQMTI